MQWSFKAARDKPTPLTIPWNIRMKVYIDDYNMSQPLIAKYIALKVPLGPVM